MDIVYCFKHWHVYWVAKRLLHWCIRNSCCRKLQTFFSCIFFLSRLTFGESEKMEKIRKLTLNRTQNQLCTFKKMVILWRYIINISSLEINRTEAWKTGKKKCFFLSPTSVQRFNHIFTFNICQNQFSSVSYSINFMIPGLSRSPVVQYK